MLNYSSANHDMLPPPKNLTENFYKLSKELPGFTRVLEKAVLVCAADGRCLVTLKIGDEHVNHFGYLHGSLSATLIDCVSGYALITLTSSSFASVDLHLSFLKSAKKGEEVEIDGCVLKQGRNLAFLEATVRNKETKELLVKGNQTVIISQ